MKKTLINNIKFIAFGLILAIGASYVYANTQTVPPPCTTPGTLPCPPAHNTELPINVGVTNQEKGVGSTCDTAGNNCGLAVGGFIATKDAQFDGKVFLKGPVYGVAADKSVHAGDATRQASVNVSGRLYTASYFQSDTLKHAGGLVPVCNDASGNVILCP